MRVPFSYLDRQFATVDDYLADIKQLVLTGDFTLGAPLSEFERRFAELCGVPHAIGVGSGTDALIYAMKALGIGPGDEVITTPATFHATVGAIVMAGARPIFVDSEDGFVIDAERIESTITPQTKAIMPVHYTGNVADMNLINEIAKRHGLMVIEDACQAIGAALDGRPVGSLGDAAAFSLHPLKNLNVWGDGGVITTRSDDLARRLRLLRNHGMVNRDEIEIFGGNSRLDTLQAVVGNRLLGETQLITSKRIENARKYDEAFAELESCLRLPIRRTSVKHVFHLYMLRANDRDGLLRHLNAAGVEAKVHYPIPVHLQKAARYLGYREGAFPVAEADARQIITLPAHQHLSDEEIDYTIDQVFTYYKVVRHG